MSNTRKRNKGNKGNKSRKSRPTQQREKSISDYLKDDLFPIHDNQYIKIEIETCLENGRYNYKVSSIKKKDFNFPDIPEYNHYPSLTIDTLQEGINKLILKENTQFIRLMIISGDEGLKLYRLVNISQDLNKNKDKCGKGTPIYTELIPIEYDDKTNNFIEINPEPIVSNSFGEEIQIPTQNTIDPPQSIDYIPKPVNSILETEDMEYEMLSFTLDRLKRINRNKNLSDELQSVFLEFNTYFENEDIPTRLQKMFEYALHTDYVTQKTNIGLVLNGIKLLIIYKEIDKKIEELKNINDNERLEFNDIYGLLEEIEIPLLYELDIINVMNKTVDFNTLKIDQIKYILQIKDYVNKEVNNIINKLENPDVLENITDTRHPVEDADDLELRSQKFNYDFDEDDEDDIFGVSSEPIKGSGKKHKKPTKKKKYHKKNKRRYTKKTNK